MPSQQQKLPTKGVSAADKDRYQTVVRYCVCLCVSTAFVAKIVTMPCGPQVNQSGLSQNKLQALALRLQVWP